MFKKVIRYNVRIVRINRPIIEYSESEQQRRREAGENLWRGYYEESEEEQVLRRATLRQADSSASGHGHSYPLSILTATAWNKTKVSVAFEGTLRFDDKGALKVRGYRWTGTDRDCSVSETWTITPA